VGRSSKAKVKAARPALGLPIPKRARDDDSKHSHNYQDRHHEIDSSLGHALTTMAHRPRKASHNQPAPTTNHKFSILNSPSKPCSSFPSFPYVQNSCFPCPYDFAPMILPHSGFPIPLFPFSFVSASRFLLSAFLNAPIRAIRSQTPFRVFRLFRGPSLPLSVPSVSSCSTPIRVYPCSSVVQPSTFNFQPATNLC